MTTLIAQDVVPSSESYRLIPLTRGLCAIVDSADFAWLNQWKWCASPTGYALRRERGIVIWMHNLILGTPKTKRGDHWNGDTLDNRRCNLRILTQRRNSHNACVGRNNTSGCTGVSLHKSTGKWHAYITPFGGKRKTLGYYEDADEAITSRKAAEKKYYGEVIRAGCPARIKIAEGIVLPATRAQRINSSSGMTGVSRHRGTGKWMARVFIDKTTHYLGLHSTKRQAHKARVKFLASYR